MNTMNDQDVELLLRAIEGRLSVAEQREFDARLEHEPALRQAMEDLRGLQRSLNADTVKTFSPSFVDKVMVALELAGQAARNQTEQWLSWSFRRIAAVAAVIAVSIAAYNLSVDGSLVNVPAVNLVTANTPSIVEFP